MIFVESDQKRASQTENNKIKTRNWNEDKYGDICICFFFWHLFTIKFWKCHKQEIHTVHRFMLVSYYCTKLSWVEITIVIPLCFNKVILRILLGLRLIFGLLINCKIAMIVKLWPYYSEYLLVLFRFVIFVFHTGFYYGFLKKYFQWNLHRRDNS